MQERPNFYLLSWTNTAPIIWVAMATIPFEQQTLMALGKYWDMYYHRDRPAPAAFYRPQYILPTHVAHLHGKRDSD